MRQKRTDYDFSKHELIIEEKDGYLKHTLKHPEYSKMHLIEFLNIQDKLIVSGDYGNWMFCREFHPSEEGYVSDGYWLEKLRMNSTQDPYEYNSEKTAELIKEKLKDLDEKYYNDDIDGYTYYQYKEYYENECLNYVDDEIEYQYNAFRGNIPSNLDYEDIPYVRTVKPQLNIVFDAFDEICKRLKK